ncbi:MAG: DUF6036 family nucleotidyltransferase [Actinomycetota bacterium]
MDTTPGWGSAALRALSEQLQDSDARFELVVVGGSALVALGLVSRVTRDIDVVGILAQGELVPADPLPEPLVAAGARVARDLGLPPDWLNAGPTALLDFGLPSGFLDRVHRVDVGPSLAVLYADRFDQIHLKLYAMVDQAGGRHEDDLRALTPTPDELLIAARWTRTHDPSPGFRGQLLLALERLGVDDADVE